MKLRVYRRNEWRKTGKPNGSVVYRS
jgi:hypothetical protein